MAPNSAGRDLQPHDVPECVLGHLSQRHFGPGYRASSTRMLPSGTSGNAIDSK